MMHLLVSCVFAAAAGPNLLTNPNFGEAMTGWEVQAESAEVARAAPEGPLALHLSVPPEKLVGYPRVLQRFTCAPEAVYEARVLAKGVDVRDGYGAYMTLEFVDGAGKRINFFQGSAAEPDGTWSEIGVRGVAPPEAAKSMICCVLNGHGNAWFREASVTLTVTDQRPCARFLGFGFEDDGWLYNPMNAEHGVDAAG
ncbi:MAG: hypothetical protein HYV26_04835, partial [Candidatus Hydrogenedentes bacterium]|nr:hypothetical protein [Candidatus Hydrogenedentota bacterium]